MIIFYDPEHGLHDPQSELKGGEFGSPQEAPERLERVLTALTKADCAVQKCTEDYGIGPILAVHGQDYVIFLEEAWARWRAEGRSGDILPLVWPGDGMRRDVMPLSIDGKIGLYCFDIGTPITRHTYKVAYGAAQCAAASAAAITAENTEHALCLTRPPGHHAMPSGYGGYCFFNQAAIAAQKLIDDGKGRIAILDVDYHHGNGTQSIFYNRSDVLVINIHADPDEEYPYFLGHADETGVAEGTGFNKNYPLPRGTGWERYKQSFDIALQEIQAYEPEALIVSLGLDTGEHDPLGHFTLNRSNYSAMGEAIRALNLPLITVLEGGYDRENIGDYLIAYLGSPKKSADEPSTPL